MTPHISISLLRTQSDERLVAMTAAGHDRAFEAIVDRYRRPLLRYAHRMLHEEARAEDVVQAGLVSAWAALREGVQVRDLRPWLYRIVHNGALNAMKRPTAEPLAEASDLSAGPDTVIERRDEVRRAFDGIASLPERQRAALLAVAFEGRSHAEVGEELGLRDTAVRQLVSRARASLRTAATALTPYPLVVWAATNGGSQADEMGARIGELVAGAGVLAGAGAGAGTVLGGGAAVKAGAVLATAGVLAVGAPKVAHVIREDSTPAPAAAAPAAPRGATAEPVSAPAPSATRHDDGTSGGSGHEGSGDRHGGSGSGSPGSSGHGGSSGDDDGSGSSGISGEDHSGSGTSGSDDRSGSRHRSGSSERSGRSGGDDRSGSGTSGGEHSGSGEPEDATSGGGDDHGSTETSDSSGSSGGESGSSQSGSGSGSSGSSESSSGTSGSSGEPSNPSTTSLREDDAPEGSDDPTP